MTKIKVGASYKKKHAKNKKTVTTKAKYKYPITGSLTGNAFGRQKVCKMVYCENATLTSTSGVPQGYLWSHNSIYDADASGVGHQPYFYDQLDQLYKANVVTGCKIELEGAAGSNCVVTIRPTTSAVLPSNLTLEGERPNCKRIYMTATGGSKKISHYISTANLFGRSKNCITDEDDFRGVGGNPAQRSYWAVCIQHPDQTSSVSIYFNVKLTFYVKWCNLKLLSQS